MGKRKLPPYAVPRADNDTVYGKLRAELREALEDRDVLLEALYVFVRFSDSGEDESIRAVLAETRERLSAATLAVLDLWKLDPPWKSSE